MILSVTPQIRTLDLNQSIAFYVEKMGMEEDFRFEDFYAGIKAGSNSFHIKLVDKKDPTTTCIENGEHFHLYFATDAIDELVSRCTDNGVEVFKPLTNTPWNSKEFVIKDPDGNILYFSQAQE